jgi:hypothetical protein
MSDAPAPSKKSSRVLCTCGCGKIVAYSTKRAHLRGQTRPEIAAAILETTRYLQGEDNSQGSSLSNKRLHPTHFTHQDEGRKRHHTLTLPSSALLEAGEHGSDDNGTNDDGDDEGDGDGDNDNDNDDKDEDEDEDEEDGDDGDCDSDGNDRGEDVGSDEEGNEEDPVEAEGEGEGEFGAAEITFSDWVEEHFLSTASGQ